MQLGVGNFGCGDGGEELGHECFQGAGPVPRWLVFLRNKEVEAGVGEGFGGDFVVDDFMEGLGKLVLGWNRSGF